VLLSLAGTAPPGEAAQLLADALAIATAAGAPWPVRTVLANRRAASLVRDKRATEAELAAATLMADTSGNDIGGPDWLTLATARLGIIAELKQRGPLPADMAERLDALMHTVDGLPTAQLPAGDPLRQMVARIRAAGLLTGGDKPGAWATAAKAGLDFSSCEYADQPLTTQGYAIADSDYPIEARSAGVTAVVAAERQVAADGRTAGVRMVFARPPLALDAPTIAANARATHSPPRRGGKPYPCRTTIQRVRWRLD
jgi:hypothetical protein